MDIDLGLRRWRCKFEDPEKIVRIIAAWQCRRRSKQMLEEPGVA